jgi:hypothetical protein
MGTLPPISSMVMNDIFRPLGLSPSKLRQDRILDEARHTADPVHLMRVFGITTKTAMRYVYTAHPEHTTAMTIAPGHLLTPRCCDTCVS